MGRFGVTPVHPSAALAQAIGERIARARPAPDANLGRMGDIQEGVGKVYRHAEMLNDQGPNGYRVQGWQMESAGSPSQVGLSRTTLNDWLRDNGYGADWDQVRASLLDQEPLKGHVLAPDYRPAGGLENTLDRPLYIATVEGEAPGKIVGKTLARSNDGVVQIAPNQLAAVDATPMAGLQHEMGHISAPPSPTARLTPHGVAPLDPGPLRKRLLDENPGMSDPDAARIGQGIAYRNRPAELLANLGNLRRLEYGLTGNTLTTPEGISRAFDRWLGGKIPQATAAPHKMGFGRFTHPIMEHGPRAGQPAENYYDMLQSLRYIYEQADPKTQKVIQSLAPRVSSIQGDEINAMA